MHCTDNLFYMIYFLRVPHMYSMHFNTFQQYRLGFDLDLGLLVLSPQPKQAPWFGCHFFSRGTSHQYSFGCINFYRLAMTKFIFLTLTSYIKNTEGILLSYLPRYFLSFGGATRSWHPWTSDRSLYSRRCRFASNRFA